jgi:hypothetical protein
MKPTSFKWLPVALMMIAVGRAAAGDGDGSLAGTWLLDDRSSEDPVRELTGEHATDGLGRRVARSVNIFGFPVGSVIPDEAEDKEDPPAPQDVLGALSYVFEATYRLRITQSDGVTEIRYGNAPSMIYRSSGTFENGGWKSKVEWRDGQLAIAHERIDGASVSERYFVEERTEELHWTARFKHPKSRAVEVERVFYRAPDAASSSLPFTARTSR